MVAGEMENKAILQLEVEVEVGAWQKLPREKREQIIYEEEKNRLAELAEAKKSLWKLLNKEKKLRKDTMVNSIRELGKRASKIATILEEERQKIKAEKERKKHSSKKS